MNFSVVDLCSNVVREPSTGVCRSSLAGRIIVNCKSGVCDEVGVECRICQVPDVEFSQYFAITLEKKTY